MAEDAAMPAGPQPDQAIVDQLIGMGFAENGCKRCVHVCEGEVGGEGAYGDRLGGKRLHRCTRWECVRDRGTEGQRQR
jgi:hypothetical protein